DAASRDRARGRAAGPRRAARRLRVVGVERFKLIVAESLRSLGANVSTTLAATVTVLIGMFLLGLFIAFGTWVVSWSNHVKRQLVVHVYYCTTDTCASDATQAQMNRIANIATSSPLVKRVQFVPKEKALE